MPRSNIRYVCQQCGYESPKWLGKCPDCNSWNTMSEEAKPVESAPSRRAAQASAAPRQPATPITQVEVSHWSRSTTRIGEFDRVLGGGVVGGSVVLIGGDPGIGKSTLLMQVAAHVSADYGTALYISGEESVEQIKLRAERTSSVTDRLYLLAETNIAAVLSEVERLGPRFIIVDSIQTMFDPTLESAPATVSQVRTCTAHLVRIAKNTDTPIFIVGHVTKEGAIAGPRVLEHMVDTVLYFEGDRHQSYRVLRAVKNRFGSADEIGVFEMHEEGLEEVGNPSEIFLSERPESSPGSAVAVVVEGSRPLLVEVQALVSPTHLPAPRRMASGVEANRMALILAVLEKRLGLAMGTQDVYVNVAGGIRVIEPAVDLAVAMAIASSFKDVPVPPRSVFIGEVGLAGEIRSVTQAVKRLTEAARLGFEEAVLSHGPAGKRPKIDGMQLYPARSLREAVYTSLVG
ncbi:MAG: DNA repair protein RadA [Armatimonadetes bacterium]|nr:DNA repair protein RadA [Armatimonadota bacterium]